MMSFSMSHFPLTFRDEDSRALRFDYRRTAALVTGLGVAAIFSIFLFRPQAGGDDPLVVAFLWLAVVLGLYCAWSLGLTTVRLTIDRATGDVTCASRHASLCWTRRRADFKYIELGSDENGVLTMTLVAPAAEPVLLRVSAFGTDARERLFFRVLADVERSMRLPVVTRSERLAEDARRHVPALQVGVRPLWG
jgi:hypothetical protein